MPNSNVSITFIDALSRSIPLIIASLAVGVVIGWLAANNANRKTVTSLTSLSFWQNRTLAQTKNIKQLERQLVGLVHGDKYAVHRIMSNLRKTYPRKSATWLYEKAIHDLRRDRH